MFTVGVDLAAEPKKTALACISWHAGGASLDHLQVGVDDDTVIDRSRGAGSVGIDCAFGWPIEFVEFLTAHAAGRLPDRDESGLDWRRRLAYRHTDRFVRELTGQRPLSVATDRLGLTAMRCAELLEAFARDGGPVDRSGAGRVVEVYPAVALRQWEVAVRGYKTTAALRRSALETLTARAPWLRMSDEHVRLIERSDDAFDAVVSALIARAHYLGLTHSPPPEARSAARVEGWIAVPSASLDALVLSDRCDS